MHMLRVKGKAYLLKVVSCFFFYTQTLKLVNLFANAFQAKRDSTGARSLPRIVKRASRNVQILTYHRVNDEQNPFFPATPTTVFTRQMEFLSSCFNILSLGEAVARLKHKDIPDNAVVITFDDGYKDNYLHAFPVLKKFSVPATIFLATDAIGSGRMLWHDQVFSAFRETKKSVLSDYGEHSKTYSLRTLEDKLVTQAQILRFLRSLDEHKRSLWIACLREKLDVADGKNMPELMLTWDEVKTMHLDKISFGSHTVTHPILSKISPERVWQEISVSKAVIERHLGEAVRAFAYPNGTREDFRSSTKDLLGNVGYTCAVTSVFGANDANQDVFELRRGGPWEMHLPTFAIKLNWYKFVSS